MERPHSTSCCVSRLLTRLLLLCHATCKLSPLGRLPKIEPTKSSLTCIGTVMQAIRDAARRSSGSAALWPVRFLLDRVLPQGSAPQTPAAPAAAVDTQAPPSPPSSASNGSTPGAGIGSAAAGSSANGRGGTLPHAPPALQPVAACHCAPRFSRTQSQHGVTKQHPDPCLSARVRKRQTTESVVACQQHWWTARSVECRGAGAAKQRRAGQRRGDRAARHAQHGAATHGGRLAAGACVREGAGPDGSGTVLVTGCSLSFATARCRCNISDNRYYARCALDCCIVKTAHTVNVVHSQLQEVANAERDRLARLEAGRPSPADQPPPERQHGAAASTSVASADSLTQTTPQQGGVTDAARGQAASKAGTALQPTVRLAWDASRLGRSPQRDTERHGPDNCEKAVGYRAIWIQGNADGCLVPHRQMMTVQRSHK